MTILITGASGQLGRLVVPALVARGVDPTTIRAGARDVSGLADLAEQGIDTVTLDYDRPETVPAALPGVDRVLLISGSVPGDRLRQHRTVIDAAAAAGVEQFVYTSAPRARSTALRLAPEHAATEEAIEAAGLPATILRNNWYTENYGPTAEQARATGVVLSSAGDGRVASASRRDYAEAAAAVLTGDGHVGRTYELGGDVAWTFAELAATLATVLGREVELRSVSTPEHVAALIGAGLDEQTAAFVAGLDADIAGGALADVTGDLARLIGRPTTPLEQGLRETLALG